MAKLVRPVSDAASTETAGDARGAAGTFPYMAPEQLRSETVDARTDVHAAGAVLYEMSSGRRPFCEATAPRLIHAILHQMPPAPRALNPRISPRLEELILKCLDKNPGRRYQSAKELRVDLERLGAPVPDVAVPQRRWSFIRWVLTPALVLAAILALLIAFDAGGLRQRLSGGMGTPRIESLAVLPLDNLYGDPNQGVLVDGITEALTAELSKIKALKKVISRTSMMQYKGTSKPIRQIAGELGVDALIEGSAIREGDTVRITVQLIHGGTDAHLWAESFDREYRNILALHSEVARAIAREVKAVLTPAEVAGFSKAPTVNPEAYSFFVRGNEYLWRRTTAEADTRTAIEMYERAVELDSGFAPAHAALSEAHGQMWRNYYDRSAGRVVQTKAAAHRALELQPDISETHRALGLYYYWCELDYDRALQELALAQSTKPNDSRIYASIGAILRSQGKMGGAVANFIKSAELDPLSAMPVHAAAQTFTFMRNYDEAARYENLAIKLAPDWPRPYGFRALCDLRLAGNAASTRGVVQTAQRIGLGNDPLIAYARTMVDLYDRTLQEASMRLPSEAWEVCESQFHFVPKALLQAQIHELLNQPQRAKLYYESARRLAEARVRQLPDEAFFHGALGIAYAGLGRKQDAIRKGTEAMDLLPVSKDAFRGPT
ncbi:MAG: protein kinase [Acidobacteria bacterium]|nr:protein kinase [Acidobacteriota bacterium]